MGQEGNWLGGGSTWETAVQPLASSLARSGKGALVLGAGELVRLVARSRSS